jgi:AmmeMemoRadiSam system protein B
MVTLIVLSINFYYSFIHFPKGVYCLSVRGRNQVVREPIVEGIFYPKRRGELEARVRETLEAASKKKGNAAGLILPHAGYEYSARLLGAGFSAASSRAPERVICIATVHREEEDSVFLSESTSFRTPLGTVPVDIETSNELAACSTAIVRNDIPHLEEHSIEVLLPYIQIVFPGVPILPILLGRNSPAIARILGKALVSSFGGSSSANLVIVSSNLARNSTPAKAEESARRLVSLGMEGLHEEVMAASGQGMVSACGPAGIAGMLLYLGGTCAADVRGMESVPPDGGGEGETVWFGSVAFLKRG